MKRCKPPPPSERSHHRLALNNEDEARDLEVVGECRNWTQNGVETKKKMTPPNEGSGSFFRSRLIFLAGRRFRKKIEVVS